MQQHQHHVIRHNSITTHCRCSDFYAMKRFSSEMSEIWRFGSIYCQTITGLSDTGEYEPVQPLQTVRTDLYGGVLTCGCQ